MDHANDNRPASYDREVVNHIPLMRKIACRYGMPDTEEFVQEVCAELVTRWADRSEHYKFATWVWTISMNVRSLQRRAKFRKKRFAPTVSIDAVSEMACQPNQDDAVALAQIVCRMSGTRDSDILIRHAMGEDLATLGREYGIGRERARQLADRERKRLRAA